MLASFVLALLACSVACEDEQVGLDAATKDAAASSRQDAASDDAGGDAMPPSDAGAGDAGPSDAGDLDAKIAATIARLRSETCFSKPDVSSCSWGTFAYAPERFAFAEDTGEAILVLDDFPSLPTRAVRYQNRIKAFLRASGDRLEPATASWRMPTLLYETLDQFATSPFIPAARLRALRDPVRATFGSHGIDVVGHGSTVLSLLVEESPRNALVLVDQINLAELAAADFCNDSDATAVSRLQTRAERLATELRRVMRELGVGYVNFSAGPTLASMEADWARTCGRVLPPRGILLDRLATYAPLVRALFATPGVFAAHAAIAATDREAFPFDWPSPEFRNRLRVGYFTELASGLDAEGRGPTPSSAWPSPANADVFLNSGVLPVRPFAHNDTPLLQTDELGLDVMPLTQTTTSWITPLALARFIHARHTYGANRPLDDALIAELLARVVPASCPALPGGSCIYQDPLAHGQTEAVRLGLRPLR